MLVDRKELIKELNTILVVRDKIMGTLGTFFEEHDVTKEKNKQLALC